MAFGVIKYVHKGSITMNIAITSDSALDLSEELLKEYDVATAPFAIVMGEKEAFDGLVKGKDVFAYTEQTGKLAKTAAVNEKQCEELFEKALKSHDAVIHFTISSDMSASYTNACLAAKRLKNVYVIDSRSLSTGIGLQVIYACKLAKAGYSPEEIVKMVGERTPFVQASFGCEAVNYLYKGGRCSALSALGANILKIRPQIIVKDGKMIPGKKFRGPMSKWVPDYVEETLSDFPNPDYSVAFITYSSAPDEIVEMVRTRLYKAGFQKVYNTTASCTVACHCGPGTLGILYINDGKHEIAPK